MIESSTPETVLALPRPCQLAPIVKAKLPKIEKFRKIKKFDKFNIFNKLYRYLSTSYTREIVPSFYSPFKKKEKDRRECKIKKKAQKIQPIKTTKKLGSWFNNLSL